MIIKYPDIFLCICPKGCNKHLTFSISFWDEPSLFNRSNSKHLVWYISFAWKKNLNIYYANIQNLSNKNYHLHYWNENCMITDKVCSFTWVCYPVSIKNYMVQCNLAWTSCLPWPGTNRIIQDSEIPLRGQDSQ